MSATHTPVTDAAWCSAAEVRRLVRVCTAITGDPAAAEDLAQETLAQAWQIRGRLVDPSGVSAWLDAIARHVCHRWRVRLARRVRHEHPTATVAEPAPHDPMAELLERDELVDLVERALGLLPAETREVLVARYVEELPPAEIARRRGTTADAVSMRLLRGRTRLRHLLEDELADAPAAEVWRSRYGVAWRSTRLRCPDCAAAALLFRRDAAREVVELRCARCGPDISAAYRLDNPVLGPRLAGVTRPSAVVSRMAAWSAGYWPADGTGTVACTSCARPVRVAGYRRPEPLDERIARGWVARCACGEEQTTSLGGVALFRQETRRLRERRPGARAVPTRRLTVDGVPALAVGYRDRASGEGVDVLFADGPDVRLLAVVPTR